MAGYNPATDDSFRREAQRKADAESAFRKVYGPDRSQPAITPFTAPSIERPAPTAAIPTISGNSAYEGFDDQYTSFATRNAADNAARAKVNVSTPDERTALALSPNPYGTKEAYFDNAGMERAGYDKYNMNTMSRENVIKGGYNDAGVSAALQAAAARGDWDAVGRYYASKGESFGGKMYGGGDGADMNKLYRTAMGLGASGPQRRSLRDRAANMFSALNQNQAMLTRQGMGDEAMLTRQGMGDEAEMRRAMLQAAAQRYGADATSSATREATAQRTAAMQDATEQRAEAVKAANRRERIKQYKDPAYRAWINSLSGPERLAHQALELQDYAIESGTDVEIAGNLYGVKSFANGGQIQPVLNPMGNMGMPSSMADLDPAVRQYAQYVSTATQYGLQPIAFPKFIDLLGAARSKLMQYPTQGGSGFADGGVVGWLKSFLPGVGPLDTPAPAPAPMPQAQPQPAPTIQGTAQAIQGRSGLNNSALEAAMQARRGYAGGGAVGPFGDFSRASRRLDTTRSGEDPYTYQAKVDALTKAYFPNAVPGAASPDEFTRMIQAGLASRNIQFPQQLPAPWGQAKNLSNYAGGGAIPVAGQQVLGPGGPKTDSIPAIIDGQQPAALSSGEFVMPVEAVKFFGTDKLNKMIQQARGVK